MAVELTRIDDDLEQLADFPVFCAYNTNVDAIMTVDERLEDALEPPVDEKPEKIESRQDLASAIAQTMKAGEGDEIPMSDEFGAWLEEHVEPDERRLGGQAGIMANLLSVIGAAPVFYTYMLSETQRSMFQRPDDIEFPVVEDDELTTRPMSEVTNSEHTKINWVFEFSEGQEFFDVTAETDTRFIAAARPERFNLDAGEIQDRADELGELVDGGILAGYHSLKNVYADGSDWREHLDQGKEFLRGLRERNDDIKLQVEYAVTHNEELRKAMHQEIVSEVDAIGIDSRELGMLQEDLGVEVEPSDSKVVRRYRALEGVLDACEADSIKFHATNYFMAVRTDDYIEPEAIREGFEFAAFVAAAKATKGRLRGPEDLSAGKETAVSEEGVEAIQELADVLGVETDGHAIVTDDLVVVPNRVVDNPVSTVGLGDVVSASNFALENALAKKD